MYTFLCVREEDVPHMWVSYQCLEEGRGSSAPSGLHGNQLQVRNTRCEREGVRNTWPQLPLSHQQSYSLVTNCCQGRTSWPDQMTSSLYHAWKLWSCRVLVSRAERLNASNNLNKRTYCRRDLTAVQTFNIFEVHWNQ